MNKITAIAFVYNEIDYLPMAIQYYKDNGCDVYIIDNMSNDGTWEWLQENGIPSHRFDSMEAFQLEWLQEEMVKTLHRIKPAWFVWFAPDMFHVHIRTIRQMVEVAEHNNCNQIFSPCYSFKRIKGEDDYTPLPLYFRYAVFTKMVQFCSKYHENLSIFADRISIPNPKVLNSGIIFEYGGCKPFAIQDTKLKRRQKAWELGTPPTHGSHYLTGKKTNWIHDKKDLIDVWEHDPARNHLLLLMERLQKYVTP